MKTEIGGRAIASAEPSLQKPSLIDKSSGGSGVVIEPPKPSLNKDVAAPLLPPTADIFIPFDYREMVSNGG